MRQQQDWPQTPGYVHHKTLLRLTGIVKNFPGIRALDGVDFDLRSGEVHVLFGENGAGKSTIINIIAGTFAPDSGTYEFDGEQITGLTPITARQRGIQPVFQEFSLIPELTVVQNIFLGRELTRWGMLDNISMRAKTVEIIERLQFNLDPDAKVGGLSRACQQMVEIVKAMLKDVRILILDEPTASLTDAEAERLFTLVDQLRRDGVAIIYVSHRMKEIARLADRITVLRDGKRISTVKQSEVTDSELITLMTGREIGLLFPEIKQHPGRVVLEIDQISTAGGQVKNASIHARAGEIVGIAGLVGCGKSELIRAVYGLDNVTSGCIRYNGTVLPKISPRQSLQSGLCYFPSDRAREGLALTRSIRENGSMAALDEATFARNGLLRCHHEKTVIQAVMDQLHLRPPSIERQVGNLSGGNRQKVLLARGNTRPMTVFLFDEPTVGIDVGAKLEVYEMMRQLVDEGKTVILVSSELSEVMGLSNRIYVMHDGQVVAHIQREDFSEAAILAHFFPKHHHADLQVTA